ncbi:MAG: hypothetical protein MJ195_00865 [Mycoplasmoidaceae bacterium]|nr:hypothetical protein [Mycoplasmoidaceae bacterium]
MATPYIFEEDAIKYIDLDLDVRVIDVNSQIEVIRVLDEKEFDAHAEQMLYPKKLINKAKEVKDDILQKLQTKSFQNVFNSDLFKQLDKIINKPKRKNYHGK